ncbi:MAG TPA: shikimate kinase [Acidimicrobiia bacterium]|nr:shikimate kinase [Acidimicrobiia bacterium]
MIDDGSRRHLVLVGLMGAGKTTVGAACATRLARPFVDTDDVVEANTGMSVRDVFTQQGESSFRQLERRAVEEACATPTPAVIACGGGAVLDGDNRRRLQRTGFVVWLQADPATLMARVKDGTERPLLEGRGTATLERLAVVRAAAYEAAADALVDTDGLPVSQVVDAVLEVYPR